MAEDSSDPGIMEGIQEDGEYFRRLLTLVPFLVSDEVTQEEHQQNPDGTDGPVSKRKKKKKNQKQRQKTEGSIPKGLAAQQNDSSQAGERRGKKRPAVDVPESHKEEASDLEDAAPLPPKKKKKGKSKPEETTVPSTKLSKEEKKQQRQQRQREKKKQQQRVSASMTDAINGTSHPGEDATSDSREELRQRLHSKVQQARAKKGLTSTTEQGGENQKKKQKKKDKKKKKKKDKQTQEKGKGKKLQGEEKTETDTTSEAPPPAKKPLFNIRGSLIFNKLSFDNGEEKSKAGRSELVGKDYKRILQKLEKRKEKVNKLREKDGAKAAALEDKLAWKDAVSKAAGVKVKDDEALVKRSLKRKMKIKDQRKKKWRDRQKTVRKNIEEKQAKREKNIEARKESKKQKKYKKMVKKGRIVPGMNN